jgi:cyanophycinase
MQRTTGYILLEGGAEFGGRMADPDRRALALAGGPDAPVAIVPAAAAPDRNHQRAGQNGVRWFTQLGAQRVSALPLIDRASAERDDVVAALAAARLIYLLGGFTHYLGQTLSGSRAWQAVLEAHRAGAVVAGSSAGAMVLCAHYYHPEAGEVVDGLGLVPGACVIPHHNSFGARWASRLSALLPADVLVGIDEQTGLLDDGGAGQWTVYGRGAVTLYRRGRSEIYPAGATLRLVEEGR